MIFDRTKQDVDLALEIIDAKVKKFLSLSADEIETLERGTMTVNTLNRIESKQDELKSVLNSMGYWNTNTENKAWTVNDIFNADDLKRVFDNARILREAFFSYETTPMNPTARYHFQNLNDLEKILYDIETVTGDVTENYRYCGEIECGE